MILIRVVGNWEQKWSNDPILLSQQNNTPKSKQGFFLRYLILGIDEQHRLLANADITWRGTTFLADLLDQEIVGTKKRQGGQNL